MKYFVVFLTLVIVCEGDDDSKFYPSEDDRDYDFPKYPFQQYIQVRKSYSVEHLPSYESNVSGDDRLQKSASNHEGDSTSHQDESSHYYKPPLREEISLEKKQEVYEERGYHDGAYDHSGSGENHNHNYQSPHHETSASSNHQQKSRQKPIGSEEGPSTKILEYAASNYDKDVHDRGFYKARSHIYCPEVIDFDLSSKSQGMGQGLRPKGKRRLQGLGSKIDCLKNKYFGRELLPSAIFMEPSESRLQTIKMGSMSQFVDEIKKNFY